MSNILRRRRKGQEEFIPIFLGVVVLIVIFIGAQFTIGAQKRVVETVLITAATDVLNTDLHSMLNWNLPKWCNNKHRFPLSAILGLALAQNKKTDVSVNYAGDTLSVDAECMVRSAFGKMAEAGLQFGGKSLNAEFHVEYAGNTDLFKQGDVKDPIWTFRVAIPVPDANNGIATAVLKLKE